MSHRLPRTLAVILFTQALIACAPLPATVEHAQTTLKSIEVCCKSPQEFSYVSLSLRDRTSTYLSTQSPAFDFGKGKSFFLAYALPIGSRSVTFYSPVGGFLPTAAYIDPVIVFLDESHQVLEVQSQLPLKYGYHGLFNDHHYEVTVPIPTLARFTVLSSDPSSARLAKAYSSNGREFTISPRPIGPVLVEVR